MPRENPMLCGQNMNYFVEMPEPIELNILSGLFKGASSAYLL